VLQRSAYKLHERSDYKGKLNVLFLLVIIMASIVPKKGEQVNFISTLCGFRI